MAITLADIRKKSKTLTIEYGGEPITFTYMHSKITPEFEAQSAMVQESERPSIAVADQLSILIIDWDVMGEDGKPEPVTKELMRSMPIDFIVACANAIGEDRRPNAQSAAT